MLDQILDSCKYLVDNSDFVSIDYSKADILIEELKDFNNIHYLTKVPFNINDFIWKKGQDKTKVYNPYHQTRTTSY